jgi:uncharacterized protein
MAKSDLFVPRTYRRWIKGTDLISFNVIIKETDLYIRTTVNLKSKALRLVQKYRESLERYIARNPLLLTTLEPFTVAADAPLIVKAMADATAKVKVGPMAAVAGAIAEFVGEELSAFSSDIIIENGGDIYLRSTKKRIIGIYAGSSPLSGKVGLEIEPAETPIGVCTSSGTVGHSLSFGKADAAVVIAKSATLADAAATALGNIIKEPADISKGIAFAQSVPEIKGVLIIIGDKMGIWGEIKIVHDS